MASELKFNQRVKVFDHDGRITKIVDTNGIPKYYEVTFDDTGNTHTVAAEHVEGIEPAPDSKITSFEEAVELLGERNSLVKQYYAYFITTWQTDAYIPSVASYLQLQIITCALNEGWTPQYTQDEAIYYPSFDFFTEEQFLELDDIQREEYYSVVVKPYRCYHACGVRGERVRFDEFTTLTPTAAFVFKRRELAAHAGTYFLDLFQSLW